MGRRGGDITISRIRVLCLALLAAPVVIGNAVYIVLDGLGPYPPTALAFGLSALVLATLVLAEAVGFRPPRSQGAADTETEADQEVLHYLNATMLRFALTESPIIFALAVCFVRDDGAWPYVITTVPAMVVMAFEIWPSRRNIEKFARAVEASGRQSYVRERLLGA